MHLHPPPRAYFLPRTIYHDGEPTTLERALRRGADPTALEVDDGNGGRKPYMRLTGVIPLAGLDDGGSRRLELGRCHHGFSSVTSSNFATNSDRCLGGLSGLPRYLYAATALAMQRLT